MSEESILIEFKKNSGELTRYPDTIDQLPEWSEQYNLEKLFSILRDDSSTSCHRSIRFLRLGFFFLGRNPKGSKLSKIFNPKTIEITKQVLSVSRVNLVKEIVLGSSITGYGEAFFGKNVFFMSKQFEIGKIYAMYDSNMEIIHYKLVNWKLRDEIEFYHLSKEMVFELFTK